MEGYLTVADIAARLGVQPHSIHRYRQRPGFPPPDDHVGRTPVWREETINAWQSARRGHGWRKGSTGKKESTT